MIDYGVCFMNKEQMLELLRKDVVPALGCTEPVCVALCAASAGKLIDDNIEVIEVFTNAGIYKNGMSDL
jgi:L-cysteine desulfidase